MSNLSRDQTLNQNDYSYNPRSKQGFIIALGKRPENESEIDGRPMQLSYMHLWGIMNVDPCSSWYTQWSGLWHI